MTSESFKQVLAFLNTKSIVNLRALSRRVALDHAPSLLKKVSISWKAGSPEIISSFLAKCKAYPPLKISVFFTKREMAEKVGNFSAVCASVKGRLESLDIAFDVKSVPNKEQNEIIGRSIAQLVGLKEFTLSGCVQSSTVDAIVEECKKNGALKKVERLIVGFQSIKRTSTENFISLFSPEAIRSLECTKRNMNLYPFLINEGIKVNTLDISMAINKIVGRMNEYFVFTAPTLRSLRICLPSDQAADSDAKELLTQYQLHTYPNTAALRSLRLIDVPEIVLRDFFRPSNSLFLTDFSFQNLKEKSTIFYTDYLPRLHTGFLEDFLHEFVGPQDLAPMNFRRVLAVLEANITALRSVKLVFNDKTTIELQKKALKKVVNVLLRRREETGSSRLEVFQVRENYSNTVTEVIQQRLSSLASKQGTNIELRVRTNKSSSILKRVEPGVTVVHFNVDDRVE